MSIKMQYELSAFNNNVGIMIKWSVLASYTGLLLFTSTSVVEHIKVITEDQIRRRSLVGIHMQ